MWKKLVSLNLALVMCLALMPVSASAVTEEEAKEYMRYADAYRNTDSSDTEHEKKESFYTETSFGNLILYPYSYLYQAVPKFTNPGKIVTSYNTSRDGSGTIYGLTSNPYDFFSRDETNPPKIYAQWENARENYILYLGVGVGPTKDGKDYILDENLSNTVTLRGEDAFAALGSSSKVIGWADKEFFFGYGAKKYYPGQEIPIDSNLTVFPITGINYIKYYDDPDYSGSVGSIAPTCTPTVEIHTSDKLISATDAHKKVKIKQDDKYFRGWQYRDGSSVLWQTGYISEIPRSVHEVYADYASYPAGECCILYSALGFAPFGYTDSMCAAWTLKDGAIENVPEAEGDRYGYTFKGWYTRADGKGTKVENGTQLKDKDIIYAHWEKVADPPEDKTYTITIVDGGTFTTDPTGVLDKLPQTPTRPGYTFGGWYTGANGSGTKVEIGHIFTGPATIYPYWILNGNTPTDKVYTIIINGGGSVTTGSDGKLTSLPATPTRPGYIFDGWYTDPTGGNRVDINYVFTGPVTIYPHWRQESTSTTYYRIYTPGWIYGGSYDVSHTYAAPGTRVTIELDPWSDYELDWLSATNLNTGRELSLSERYWDEYTFTMPYSDVEIELSYQERYVRWTSYSSYATITEAPVKTGPYVWYYQDRHIHHITDGQVPDHTPITRDMFLSVLYNLSGGEKGSGTAVGSETNDAQAWATNERIVPDIYESGLWGLDKSLCRDQAAMLLFRYAGYRGYSASPGENLSHYADYSRVRPIARNGMSWALSTGLMTTTSYNTLSPQSTLTCGQAGDMFYRFVTGVARSW